MESKLFTIVEDERLIECIQQYPVVFDLNNKGYKDQQVKSNVWKLIAKDLGKDVEQCKMRWKTIRDTQRRSLNRLKQKTTTGSPAVSKSKYTDKSLQFLNRTFQERGVKSSMPASEQVNSEGGSLTAINSDEDEEAMSPSVINMSTDQEVLLADEDETELVDFPTNVENVQPQKKKKKSVRERMVEEVQVCREERNKILQGLVAAKAKKQTNLETNNPVDMFFLSMAGVVKTLPPNLVAEARMKVCQIVNELECRALQQALPPKTPNVPLFIEVNLEPPATPKTTPNKSLPPNIRIHPLMTSGSSSSNSMDVLSTSDSEVETTVAAGNTFIRL